MSLEAGLRKLREGLEAHERDGLSTVTLGIPSVRALVDVAEAMTPERLEEIAKMLDFFDRVLELADALLPGESEKYRATDHHAMQDDLRELADRRARLEGLLGEED